MQCSVSAIISRGFDVRAPLSMVKMDAASMVVCVCQKWRDGSSRALELRGSTRCSAESRHSDRAGGERAAHLRPPEAGNVPEALGVWKRTRRPADRLPPPLNLWSPRRLASSSPKTDIRVLIGSLCPRSSVSLSFAALTRFPSPPLLRSNVFLTYTLSVSFWRFRFLNSALCKLFEFKVWFWFVLCLRFKKYSRDNIIFSTNFPIIKK